MSSGAIKDDEVGQAEKYGNGKIRRPEDEVGRYSKGLNGTMRRARRSAEITA